MAIAKTRDYFHLHITIMKYFLLIPPKNIVAKVIYGLVAIPHFVILFSSIFLESIELCVGGRGDFSFAMLNLGLLILHCIGVNRVVGWFFIQNDFEEVLEILRRSSFSFELFSFSNLRPLETKIAIIYIKTKRNSIDTFRLKKSHQSKLHSILIYFLFLFYVILNITISYYFSYFNPTYEKFNPRLNKTSIYRDYVYPVWYPFDISLSDGYYWAGFLYQPYAFYFLMSSCICVDSLNLNTVIQLKSQAEILGHAFKYVDRNIDDVLSYNEKIELKKIRLVKCITELQQIYRCATLVNKLFSSQVLNQNLFIGITICTLLYKVASAEILDSEPFYLASMVAVCLIDPFLMCWYSQNFTMEVFDILNRVQELDWFSYPPYLRKNLVFLMKRLQKPFYFTMGRWTPLNIPMFITLLKTSYSFYTLITSRAARAIKDK